MTIDAQIWASIIPSSVVPVVIISACGLLCLALYNRLAGIVNRLRTLQRERLSEYKDIFRLEERKTGRLAEQEAKQILHFLEKQTVDVLHRARFLQKAIFWLISSIALFVLTSLTIGLSIFFPILNIIVLCVYILGFSALLFGLSYAIREILIALNPIEMERAFVQKLIKFQNS